MNFKDPAKIKEVVGMIDDAQRDGAANRAKTQALFNGNPPFTQQECDENFISTNVNFMEGPKILRDARATWNNAFLGPATYFDVKLDAGPPEKRLQWGQSITARINRVMKRNRPYMEVLKSVGAQVVMHGIGPVMWDRQKHWCPTFIALEDIGIPTNTYCSLENLDHFFVRRRWTAAQLFSRTNGKDVDPGWNKALVAKQLKAAAKKVSGNNFADDYWNRPESLEEEFKQNGGYYTSDAVPTIRVIDFFFKSDDSEQWNRRMILDEGEDSSSAQEFLFDPGNRSYAKQIEQLLHVQYGNCANVAPFRWHSVRSLGFMLFAIVHLQNRLRCHYSDNLFMQLQTWFTSTGGLTREQLQQCTLHNYAFFPEAVRIIPATERYAVDHNLVTLGMNQHRQLMSENSSSFTQDFSSKQQENMTATEAMARVNSSTAMVTGMLNDAYELQKWQYEEIARRFCTVDCEDSREFKMLCQMDGVPPALLDSRLWTVNPTRIVGSGNKTLQIAAVDRLMAARNLFPPEAQQIILRMYAEANTDDPGLSNTLVPESPEIPEAVFWADSVFTSCMAGVNPEVRTGINMIDYVERLLMHLRNEVEKTEQMGGMTTPDKVVGMQTVIAHLTQPTQSGRPSPLDRIAADPNEKERVKSYGDMIGELANYIKGYQQRLEEASQEQAQQGAGMSPEAAAKIEEKRILAESQARVSEELAQQKMQHKDMAFAADQERRTIKNQAEIMRASDKHHADKVLADMDTAAEMSRTNAMTRQELAANALKAQQNLVTAQQEAEVKAKQAKKTTTKK